MEDKQIDVVGWFKNLFTNIKASFIDMFTVIREIRQLRSNLSKISEHLDFFQVWMEKDLLSFQRRDNKNYWIRLGALIFKVEEDKSTFRKWILKGTKAIPSLYVVSPPDCKVKIRVDNARSFPPQRKWGFVVEDGGKVININLKEDDKWWTALNIETAKALIIIKDGLRVRKQKRDRELQEAREIMDINSRSYEELKTLIGHKRSLLNK